MYRELWYMLRTMGRVTSSLGGLERLQEQVTPDLDLQGLIRVG